MLLQTVPSFLLPIFNSIGVVAAVVHKGLYGGISIPGLVGCYLICICMRRQDMKDLVYDAGDRRGVVL